MPSALIREWRAMVRSQSAGDKCHCLESISTATPTSGHQASGIAMNSSPR